MIYIIFIIITLINLIVIMEQMNYIYDLETFIETTFDIEGDDEDGIKE